MNKNLVYFHNGTPHAYNQIVDDLERHGVPPPAREAYLSTLVLFEAREEKDDWQPVKSNPLHEWRYNDKGERVYRNAKTKERSSESEATSPVAREATAAEIDAAGGKDKIPEATPVKAADHEKMKEITSRLAETLNKQYGDRGDKAALDVIKKAPQAYGPEASWRQFKGWVSDTVSSSLDGLTEWARAFAGDPNRQLEHQKGSPEEKSDHPVKDWVASAVRMVANPLATLPKLALNRVFTDSKRWGFVDHDAKKLESKWGRRTANLVIASGAALGTACAAGGLIAGVATASPAIAAAGAGAAVMCHYCPGFRAWVARAPAKIALWFLNKQNVIDSKSEAESRKAIKARKDSDAAAKAKGDFEDKARSAGFADETEHPPEKVLEIAREFWTSIYEQWWKKLLADKKMQKVLTSLGQAHADDPAGTALAISEMNSKAKLPKGMAGFSAHSDQRLDRVWLDGKRLPVLEARCQLEGRGVSPDAMDAALSCLAVVERS